MEPKKKKNQKKLLVFKIIAFEPGSKKFSQSKTGYFSLTDNMLPRNH